jgi:hypothetical protein
MINDPVHSTAATIKDKEVQALQKFDQRRQSAAQRFPLFFTLMGSFGLVATFYGFEAIINRIDVLANNPVILLGVGIFTLAITGTLYKKLG